MPSNHLILCRPLLLLLSIFPSIRVFSNESVLHIRWSKYWSFSFNISPSNEHPGLISFRMDWSFSYLKPVCCSMYSSNCCFLTWRQVSQEAGQVVWYSHLFQNFPQSLVIHIICGFYLFIYTPGYVALWDSKTPHRSAGERVSWCLETSSKTPFLGWISVPNSFVSLFIFYILTYLLSKTMGCLSGCLMSSAGIQKLFCGICSAFKCFFNEFVGEKVVSLS